MTRRARTTLTAATAVALSVALAGPASAAGSGGDHGATRSAMRAVVAEGVPGVTATVRTGRGIWSATAGVGNLRTGAPRSAQDHYRAGSVAKTFVATVVLQLEAEGELSLDDTVEKWLPGVVRGNGHDGSRITVRQLLNHTSGIFDVLRDRGFQQRYMTAEGFLEHRFDELTPEELLAYALRNERSFEPGESWGYSNTNYVLAGMLIEKVTGHSYADEIRHRIIEPLDLDETSLPSKRVTLPRPGSRAYAKLAPTATGPTYDVTELNPTIAGAGGGIVSDSADLTRFYSALLRGRLLPPRQLTEMKSTYPVREKKSYGLGLWAYELDCGMTVWGHTGDIHGSSTAAFTTDDGRHSVAVNFNGDWSSDTDTVVEAEYCGR
ncbi:serine hydrolase domain-containing protein [Streptomyces paradoxus]|uniref:serine hydrolase domain-containing protein n=1 Tax=Streptomyces paradoxus TaxID=66375 RepID=UPI0037D55F90